MTSESVSPKMIDASFVAVPENLLVQLTLVDPQDLTEKTDREVVELFAAPAQRRQQHLLSEFARRTGGVVVTDANGILLVEHNISLMARVLAQGPYSASQYIVQGVTGFCQEMSKFTSGTAPLCNPFTGVSLDPDGNDPSIGVIFPIDEMEQMLQLAWIVYSGADKVDCEDVDEISDIVDMVVGKLPVSRKIKRLIDAYNFAVTSREREQLSQSEALLYGQARAKGTSNPSSQNGSVSIGGHAPGATTVTGNGNFVGSNNRRVDRVPVSQSPDSFTAALMVARNLPLSTSEKAEVVVKLRQASPQVLVEVFANGGSEFEPKVELATRKYLDAFYLDGAYTAEFSKEREVSVDFFRTYATEEHWKAIKAAIKRVDERVSQTKW